MGAIRPRALPSTPPLSSSLPAAPDSRPRRSGPPQLANAPARRAVQRIVLALACLLLLISTWLGGPLQPAAASLENDRFDGNIYALYAGNGSLVPPRSSLAKALSDGRVTALVFYLDDSSASKRFAAVVSELQRVWGNTIELIPLVTDPLEVPSAGRAVKPGTRGDSTLTAGDPSRYWSGLIPQVVVFDPTGRVVFDASGQVEVDAINAALSKATGLPLPPLTGKGSTRSFNELNSEVVGGG